MSASVFVRPRTCMHVCVRAHMCVFVRVRTSVFVCIHIIKSSDASARIISGVWTRFSFKDLRDALYIFVDNKEPQAINCY